MLFSGAGRGKKLVAACCTGAAKEGVKVGMALADAQALCPEAHFARHEPRADEAALRKLAEWCAGRFSPATAVEPGERPESLLLDVAGCGHLFGGEQELAEAVVRNLRQEGYRGIVAVADTVGVAWAVAHFGAERARGPVLVPPGTLPQALRSLPVEALRLSDADVELLRKFDIRRIDQLLRLPRAELPARLGGGVLQRIDQALGVTPELLTPHEVVEPLEAHWNFEPPTGDRRFLESVLEHLLENMLAGPRTRGLGVRRLFCTLRTATRESVPLQIGLVEPSASTRHLMELLHLQCERLELPQEICRLSVRADGVVPLEFAQGRFIAGADGAEHGRELPGLIERLSNRLGEDAVLRPRLRPDVLPEQAFRLEPWLHQTQSRRTAAVARPLLGQGRDRPLPRPPCLMPRPVPIPTAPRGPDDAPCGFEWRDVKHVVVRSWGPERLETGWWRGPQQRRDYYLVETSTGRRFWLFRTMDDRRWYMHGSFA